MSGLRIESDLGGQSIRLLVLGLVSSVLAVVVGVMVLRQADYVARFGALPFIALGGLFAAIGAVAIFAGRASTAVLLLDDVPKLGGVLRGVIETRLSVLEAATLTLSCVVLEGSARPFSESWTVAASDVRREGRQTRIPIEHALPARASVDDGSGRIEWRLECRARPELDAVFPLRVVV